MVSLINEEGKVLTIRARGEAGAGSTQALSFEPFLSRRPYYNLQLLGSSTYLSARPWRRVLYSSPTVWACVKALSDQLVALPWYITTKNKEERHRKKDKIDYYTEEVVGKFNNENYDIGVMRTNRDVLSIPMGGTCEVIYRESDAAKWPGEVDRVENIDGGTLSWTGNYEYPVKQTDPNDFTRYVVFHRDEIRRILINPRPEYNLSGYQQSPLETCYLAIDAIAKGDFYYVNLLTETPSAGILDLRDMKEEEVIKWAKSWRELLTGNEALKIPILYDHVEEARWIPFGIPPESTMYGDSLSHYTRLVHACFGLYTQDTGISERTPAGGREANLERRSWHRYKATIAVWENFWNSIIPQDLVFKYEEVNIEETERLARAQVAKANALGILARIPGALGLRELRREIAETGLVETYINTEELPEDAIIGAIGGGFNPVPTGGSRWQEQRLPEEGRRQALPAGRQPQRQEWYQRVRPKSLATMNDLTSILTDAFADVVDGISDKDLKQAIHDIATTLVPVIKEAKSFSDSYDRWLLEYYRLDSGQESLLKSKALIRKQRRAKDAIQDLLKAYNWGDISSDALLALTLTVFKAAYEDALDAFNQEILQTLYEEGLVDSPTDENYEPVLVSAIIMGELDSYAHRMVDNLNQGSQYYLYQTLNHSVMEHLSKSETRNRINDDEDIEEIIAAAGFVDAVAQTFKSLLADLISPRAAKAAAFEISGIEGAARLQAMKSMGLTMKQWLTLGPDPCPICVGNASLGSVPLDHEYDSVFGTCLWPLAHPFGECDVTFDRAELRAIIDTGGEVTLYRGA